MSADYHNKNAAQATGPAGRASRFQRKTTFLGLLGLGLVLGLCAVLIVQVGSHHTQQLLIDRLAAQLPAVQARSLDTTVVHQTFRDLQYRLVAATTVLILLLAGGLLFTVRKIAKPIDEISGTTQLIVDGHLDVIPPIQTFPEIAEIGLLINDLAMNLQEILLLTWNHTGEHRDSLRYLAKVLDHTDPAIRAAESRATLAVLNRQVEDMRAMIRAFDFYDVRLADATLLSVADSETPTAI